MNHNTEPEPYEVAVDDSVLEKIAKRVTGYRFLPEPDDEAGGWRYGVSTRWLSDLTLYWSESYDWRAAERDLNRYPQFRTSIDGVTVHYVHVIGEANGTRPLLLLHGWPGSHFEFWRLVEHLVYPSKHGGEAHDAFDLVIASLPGYGFSGRVPRPIGPRTMARKMNALMTDHLGYPRYMVQGGDWGSVVASWLGNDHADTCTAVHVNMIGWRPSLGNDGAEGGIERDALEATMTAERPHLPYAVQQATRPQTLAFALNDSPVGTAAWIIDKFHQWSDLRERSFDEVYSRDDLLTNVMIYLVNDTIGTSLWSYRGNATETAVFSSGVRVRVPTAIAKFPFELVGSTPPRSWVERYYNVVRWTEMPAGGHFAALEQPAQLVEDVRAFGSTVFPHE